MPGRALIQVVAMQVELKDGYHLTLMRPCVGIEFERTAARRLRFEDSNGSHPSLTRTDGGAIN